MAHLAIVAVRGLQGGHETEKTRALLDWIAAHSPSLAFSTWLNVGRSWAARNVAELAAVNTGVPLDGRVVNALNLLSLDDLVAFAEAAEVAGDQRVRLVEAIAARAFVLGRFDVARRYLLELGRLVPLQAPGIEAALAGPGGEEVQVALTLLRLPEPSVWMQMGPWWQAEGWGRTGYFAVPKGRAFHDIDLPMRYVSAGVLNRDFRNWMRSPDIYQDGIYGADWRAARRGRVFQGDLPAFVPEDWQRGQGYPFLRLIAWDELGRFDVCHGLTRRLSEVVLDWADRGSDSWLDGVIGDQGGMPDALRRVVVLNWRSPGAVMGGRPAGQRVFALLKGRFADSADAAAVKYWCHVDHGCLG